MYSGAAGISWNWGISRKPGGLGSPVQQQETLRNAKAETQQAARSRMIMGFSMSLTAHAVENSGRTVKQSAPKKFIYQQLLTEKGVLLSWSDVGRSSRSRSALAAGSGKESTSGSGGEQGNLNKFHDLDVSLVIGWWTRAHQHGTRKFYRSGPITQG